MRELEVCLNPYWLDLTVIDNTLEHAYNIV